MYDLLLVVLLVLAILWRDDFLFLSSPPGRAPIPSARSGAVLTAGLPTHRRGAPTPDHERDHLSWLVASRIPRGTPTNFLDGSCRGDPEGSRRLVQLLGFAARSASCVVSASLTSSRNHYNTYPKIKQQKISSKISIFFGYYYFYLFLPVRRRETMKTFEYFFGCRLLRPPVTLPHIVFGLLVPRPWRPSPPPYG